MNMHDYLQGSKEYDVLIEGESLYDLIVYTNCVPTIWMSCRDLLTQF